MNIDAALATIPKPSTERGRKLARSPGRRGPWLPKPQHLTDIRFMNRVQRAAHAQGVEIWV